MYVRVNRSASKLGLVVTDDLGVLRLDPEDYDGLVPAEPECGSVVLTEGDHGTAWQRYYSDGLWHRMGGGRARTWEWLLDQRRVRLVYDAPAREEKTIEDGAGRALVTDAESEADLLDNLLASDKYDHGPYDYTEGA